MISSGSTSALPWKTLTRPPSTILAAVWLDQIFVFHHSEFRRTPVLGPTNIASIRSDRATTTDQPGAWLCSWAEIIKSNSQNPRLGRVLNCDCSILHGLRVAFTRILAENPQNPGITVYSVWFPMSLEPFRGSTSHVVSVHSHNLFWAHSALSVGGWRVVWLHKAAGWNLNELVEVL